MNARLTNSTTPCSAASDERTGEDAVLNRNMNSELAILKDEYFPESEPENECDDIYSPSNCKACDIKSP